MTKIQTVGVGPAATYVAGDHLELVVSVVDGDGAAVDLAGLQGARYVITTSSGSTAALALKSLGSGIAVTDEAGGVLTVTLSSGDTGSLAGTYAHELEIIDALGRVATVMQGQIKIARQALLPA